MEEDWYKRGGIFDAPKTERLVYDRDGRSEYKGHPLPEGFKAIAACEASVEIEHKVAYWMAGIPLYEPYTITIKADEINSMSNGFLDGADKVECLVLVRPIQVCQNADNSAAEIAAEITSKSKSLPAQTSPFALGA